MFANKQDLPGALTGEEIKNELQLEKITSHQWRIEACSAVTGERLLQGIDWLIKDISERVFTAD